MPRKPAPQANPERRGGAHRPPAARAADAWPPIPLTHPAFVVTALAAAACLVAGTTHPLFDTDFWQHLAAGREILHAGRVPTTQIWTWPTHGQPEVTPSWGFAVLLWLFWSAGGMVGMFVWRWLTTLVAFGLSGWSARRAGAHGFSGLVVIAWAALFYRLRSEPRPESLVFVLIALQLWVHESVRRAPAGGSPWRGAALALPAIAWVWANVHLSYWIGLTLQGIYLADGWWAARAERERAARLLPLAALLVVSAAISFANPGGWQALAQPFQYWLYWRHELIFQQIIELEPIDWPNNVRTLLWLFMAGWPLLILARLVRPAPAGGERGGARRFDLAEVLVAVTFIGLAFASRRFLGFFAVAAVPFVARDVGERLALRPAPAWARSPWARAALAIALMVAGSAAEWRGSQAGFGVGVAPLWRPLAACDYMEANDVRGRGFNHYEYGGYLLWRFFPQADRLPFMDIHQSGTREDRDLFARSLGDEAAWKALDRKYRFDWALFNRYHLGGDRSLDHLDADTAFALVFLDDAGAVYVRRSGPLGALAERDGYRILGGGFGVANRIVAAGADSVERPRLRAELTRVEAGSPFHATALSLAANVLFREGRLAEARDTLRAALAIDPGYPFADSRLAEVALALGRPREAVAAARRAIESDGRSERLDATRFRAQAMIRESGEAAARPDAPIVPAKLPNGWPRGN